MERAVRELVSNAPLDAPEVLPVTRRAIDLNDYKTEHTLRGKTRLGWRNATVGDVSMLLRGNWMLWDAEAGRATVAYLILPIDSEALAAQLNTLHTSLSARPDGTASRSRVVGWQNKAANRLGREQCSLASIHRENPRAATAVIEQARTAAEWYKNLNPDLYQIHRDKAEDLAAPDYRMADSPFTSAIVNRDNVLPYHFDKGNVPGGWSMMLGLKRDIGADVNGDAGYLVIPELDVALAIENNSVTGFDGQLALHGVTPFRKVSRFAYRYTIVYYAKKGMWQCLPPEQELEAGARLRTLKERGRYERGRQQGE